jgi:hypothetical protein
MGRVLVVAIAAVIGALGTWFFVPTDLVEIHASGSAQASKPAAQQQANGTAPRNSVISNEKRRQRAEQLIGDELKYATGDRVYSADWFRDQGEQVIERAMDECFLVTETDLYLQHRAALSDEDRGDVAGNDPMAMAAGFKPSFKQIQNCANVYRAYSALHDIKLDF